MNPSRATTPTRLGQLVFATKASGLRLRRRWIDRKDAVPKHKTSPVEEFPFTLAEIRSPLFTAGAGPERVLELGKVQNLRVAARLLDGLAVAQGQTFSFWRQLGRCSTRKGFALGRQLQEGCIVPAVGGGLCQLSNSLYQAALSAKCEIVERHAHSQVIPGSAAERGLDATVAWNYVDLRFRAKTDIQLSVRLTATELVVGLRGREPGGSGRVLLPLVDSRGGIDATGHSCVTCGQTDCFREAGSLAGAKERAVFLLDEWWPEFAPFLDEFEDAELFAPLDGVRFRRPAYRFPVERFSTVRYATLETLVRSFRQHRTPNQGSHLQRALLENAASLADTYSRRLDPGATHLVTTIGLLPFLRRAGALGGRTYDVLMARDSMANVQDALDLAARRFPERKLLSDFRADGALVEEEAEALRSARHLVTCHAAISSHWTNAYRIPWPEGKAKHFRPGPAIVFPGPTVARKGAFEVQEAARRLDLEVVLLGSELEGEDFWKGVRTRKVERDGEWLDRVCAVVQPAWVEHRPRTLLTALASGCPVVASEECGLGSLSGWTAVAPGDVEGLCDLLRSGLSQAERKSAFVNVK